MASGEDIDSGMDSPVSIGTPTLKGSQEEYEAAFEEDFEDETLSERLWGLAEMFPDKVRQITWTCVSGTCKTIKYVYNFSRSATWIMISSSLILFAPLIFEIERVNMEEIQRREQRQVLLGPNAAMSGVRSSA